MQVRAPNRRRQQVKEEGRLRRTDFGGQAEDAVKVNNRSVGTAEGIFLLSKL